MESGDVCAKVRPEGIRGTIKILLRVVNLCEDIQALPSERERF